MYVFPQKYACVCVCNYHFPSSAATVRMSVVLPAASIAASAAAAADVHCVYRSTSITTQFAHAELKTGGLHWHRLI